MTRSCCRKLAGRGSIRVCFVPYLLMLDFKLICVNILSRETGFLCLRGLSPLYGATRVGSSRCPAVVYFKAALCSLDIVIRISELRACVCCGGGVHERDTCRFRAPANVCMWLRVCKVKHDKTT